MQQGRVEMMLEMERKMKFLIPDGHKNVAVPCRGLILPDAVKKLDSATMLRYCFIVQQGRVEMMLEMERKMKFLIPDGHKNVAVPCRGLILTDRYRIRRQPS